MSLESPISVIYDSNGTELSVSQSQIVSGAAQPGLMIMGSASNGGATFFRTSLDGSVFITGSIQVASVPTQSVKIDQWSANVTGAFKLDGWSPTVTGAVGVTSWLANVTASTKIDAWAPTVTGAVNLQAWVATVTASTREVGYATTNVTAANGSTTNFTFFAANPQRTRVAFFKEGASVCYIKLGATASTTSYTVQLGSNGYYETPDGYTGRVDIIFSAATGVVRATEITTP
jgi:hypothetical protein